MTYRENVESHLEASLQVYARFSYLIDVFVMNYIIKE